MSAIMTTESKAVHDTNLDHELADVLIAISVITSNQMSKEEKSNEKH